MAVGRSLNIASLGLLQFGGRTSLNVASDGLLTAAVVVAQPSGGGPALVGRRDPWALSEKARYYVRHTKAKHADDEELMVILNAFIVVMEDEP